MAARYVLEVRHLKTHFFTDDGVAAVDDVSFALEAAQTIGLVGESGSGKSVTALSIARLIDSPERTVGGEIVLDGQDLLKLREVEMRAWRGRRVSMIFQEPMTALNPVLTIGHQIAESVLAHEAVSGAEAWDRAVDAMKAVAIPDAARRARDYPYQLSDGMRQRVMIAMALVCNPTLLIADEPTTALDVTIQAQIINLLADLQERFGLTYLFISHGIPVIEHISNRIGVMCLGKLVEVGTSTQICTEPKHPYTKALLSAVPVPEPGRKRERIVLKGDVPSLINPPSGCRFLTRCPIVEDRCKTDAPPLRRLVDGRLGACHLVE
jgi:peptide/nickel transport system ATP-binding protein